jgi:hypothetical protein
VGGEQAVLEGVVVPGCGAVLATEDEDEAGVEELESWRGMGVSIFE